MFARMCGKGKKGGDRRKMENQNDYNMVMVSPVSKELDTAKLTWALSQS